MNSRDLIEAGAKAIIGEVIGELRLLAESAGPIDKLTARQSVIMAIRGLERADGLLMRLPLS
jgi:hypothetical protein